MFRQAFACGILTTLLLTHVVCLAQAGRPQPVRTEEKLKRKQHRHFNFWSQHKTNENDYFVVLRELDAIHREVGRDLDTFPDKRFDVILTDQDVFYGYTGAPEFVGGLFDGKIHVPAMTKLRSKKHLRAVLWHEYTHAVISSRTGGRCPIWLNEGFAEYEEARVMPESIAELPKLTVENKFPFTMDQLEQVFRARGQFSPYFLHVAYVQAHGVVRYMYWRYGKEKINKFLDIISKNGNFDKSVKKVFNTDQRNLIRDAVNYISKL